MSGFQFHEQMQGTWQPADRAGEERAIRFSLDARVGHLLTFLSDSRATIAGTVDVNGLASHAPLTGTMTISPLVRRVIIYDFDFTGDDGKSYRFHGQKDVSPARPVRSMTSMPATITAGDGREVGRAHVEFDLRDLPTFLATWKPVAG